MKKKVTRILVTGLLVAALAIPAVVLAQGWGQRHMMGNWGTGSGPMMGNYRMGPGQMMANDRGFGTITPEQRTQLDELDRKFYNETADLRKDLWNKSAELNTLLGTTNPDQDKVKALNKEINDLRTKLSEKNLDYQVEVRKITPDSRLGGGYDGVRGSRRMGYGPGMMGRGTMGPGAGMMGPNRMGYGMRGSGPMGYGPGSCCY